MPQELKKSKNTNVEKKKSKNEGKKSKNVTKEEKSRDGKKVKKEERKVEKKEKKSMESKSKGTPVKGSAEEKVVDALANKKKFCAKFFVDSLNCKKLMKDFVGLRAPSTCLATAMKEHSSKCRYNDIICADATRVVLQGRPKKDDFIHANWMTMPDKYRYISAQGPMEESLEDFWHMIYTEKNPSIVMICDFLEDGVQKCARYIPPETDQSQQFGIYKITRTADPITMIFDDVYLQSLEISTPSKPDAPTHVVKHYHYRNWRDHTAPMKSDSVLKLIKMLRESENKGAPVVHCSAGIGRTATFIGVDYGNQRIGQLGDRLVDVLDLVREMRLMRDKAVQSHHQFIFMLVCISDQMVAEGVPRNEDMVDLLDFYRDFMENAKKKREAKKSAKEAEKEKSKIEEKAKPEEKLEVEETQKSE